MSKRCHELGIEYVVRVSDDDELAHALDHVDPEIVLLTAERAEDEQAPIDRLLELLAGRPRREARDRGARRRLAAGRRGAGARGRRRRARRRETSKRSSATRCRTSDDRGGAHHATLGPHRRAGRARARSSVLPPRFGRSARGSGSRCRCSTRTRRTSSRGRGSSCTAEGSTRAGTTTRACCSSSSRRRRCSPSAVVRRSARRRGRHRRRGRRGGVVARAGGYGAWRAPSARSASPSRRPTSRTRAWPSPTCC